MKKKYHLVFLSILLIIFFTACKERKNNEQSQRNEQKTISGNSVFQLKNNWINQFNDTITLNSLSGKPTIMAMIYTHCEYSCPRIIADMKEIESRFSSKDLEDINFLLITIDPERDTPDTLNAFMKKNDMSPNHWTLLTGSQNNIQDMTAIIGFKYKKGSLMDFAHSNLITVWNQQGQQIYQIEGFSTDKKELVDTVLSIL